MRARLFLIAQANIQFETKPYITGVAESLALIPRSPAAATGDSQQTNIPSLLPFISAQRTNPEGTRQQISRLSVGLLLGNTIAYGVCVASLSRGLTEKSIHKI